MKHYLGPKSLKRHIISSMLIACLSLPLLGLLSGCFSMINVKTQESLSVQPMEVFIRGDASRHPYLRLLVFPFTPPVYAPGTGAEVAWAYQQELLRQVVFGQVELSTEPPQNREDALWQARQKGFDVVLFATITYLLDGSGAQPSRLEVETQILEARTGRTIWYLRQKAVSSPGPDVDMTWTVYSGQPARPYRALARDLAEQLAVGLLPPKGNGKSAIAPP